MPRARQPTDVIKAKGAKHLSQAEEFTRRAGEIVVPTAEKATPPKWLGRGLDPETAKALRSEFKRLGKALIRAGLYTDLDADTLAHYLTARHQWELATEQAEAVLTEADDKGADTWSRIQSRYFADARKCANELGLTITSRCKLVVPQSGKDEDEPEDEFTQALRRRMAGSA